MGSVDNPGLEKQKKEYKKEFCLFRRGDKFRNIVVGGAKGSFCEAERLKYLCGEQLERCVGTCVGVRDVVYFQGAGRGEGFIRAMHTAMGDSWC